MNNLTGKNSEKEKRLQGSADAQWVTLISKVNRDYVLKSL